MIDVDFHIKPNQVLPGDHLKTDDGATHIVASVGPNGCDGGAVRIGFECCSPIVVAVSESVNVVKVAN